MYDIDALIEAHWDAVWEGQCAQAERYEEALENACDEMQDAYKEQSKLQCQVDEGYDGDADRELSEEEIKQLQAEIDQLDEDMSRIADEYGVDIGDCHDRLWEMELREIRRRRR